MMNSALCQFQGQSIQDPQTNNQQLIYKTKNEKQAIQEVRYLNFDNYIVYKSYIQYWRAEISNDEKYLAILGREFQKIQIYYLKNKKIIKIIQSENKKKCQFKRIKFSNNSRYLFVGDDYGCLYCYDINMNFNLIYNQKQHSRQITDIITIDEDQILTCSYDRFLIITNIKSNQQLLKIQNAHELAINSIDFDKSNDFIISCSDDKSIKLFNRKDGKCYIESQKARYAIEQVQLISEDNNLISCDYRYLFLWQIDYQRLELNILKCLIIRSIFNFTSVLNNNIIVLICNESIVILNKDLEVLESIKHNTQIDQYTPNRQLNSQNYIIIPGYHDLLILKQVRRLNK